MEPSLADRLNPAAFKRLAGTDLEYDIEKLQQLALVVPEEQEQVVRAHLSLRLPWADAFSGKTLRAGMRDSPLEPRSEPAPEPPRRAIERRRIADLKPNRFNAALFPDSLSETSIMVLADDLARNGQRVPGEVAPDGTIIDCERRWRAAKLLGWEAMDVTIVDGLTDDDLLDRVLDACTSVRHLTVREQVNVYAAVHDRLKREAGRQQGRPEKTFPKGNVYLTPRSIRDAAATRAGFSSAALAARAEAVFSRGSDDLQSQVRAGALSISAAYEALPKRGRTPPEPPAIDGVGVDESAEAGPAAGSNAPTSQPTSVTDNDGPPDDELEPADEGTNEDSASQDNPEAEPTEGDEGDDQPDEDQDGEDSGPALTEPIEDEEPDVSVHVSAICHHLSQLAELNYEDAVAWFDQILDDLRASLGEPPETQEEFDE